MGAGALEDSIMLAKSLRDNADVELTLIGYGRSRVEKVAKLARRANLTKVAGPLLRSVQYLLMPVVFKYVVHPETEAWLYQYQINWDEQGSTETVSTS